MLAVIVVPAIVTMPGFAAEETKIEAPIKQVIVYPDRAKVTRIAELDLIEGDHAVLVENLPGGVIDGSIRASAEGTGGITLLGLSHSSKQHQETPVKKVAELERELKDLERNQKQAVIDRLATLEQLKTFVTTLGSAATEEMSCQVTEGGIDVAQWRAAYEFLGSKNFSLSDSIRVARQELQDIDVRIGIVRGEVRKLSTTHRRITKTVRVELALERAGDVQLTIEYIIPGARWTPLYDARLDGDTDDIRFTYYAEVSQKTGEDWADVDLTLSTTRPSLGAGPGELSPWFLAEVSRARPSRRVSELDRTITVSGTPDILHETQTQGEVYISAGTIKNRPVQTVDALLEQVAGVATTASREVFPRGGRAGEVAYNIPGIPMGDPLSGGGQIGTSLQLVSSTIQSSGTYPAVFKIKRAESVPSGGDAVRVTVAEWILEGKTRLASRPRNRQGAYRIVTIKNQDKAPLMPGWVSIFAGTHYLGQTQFGQLVAPGEEFDLPFGLDNHVVVEREVLAYKKTPRGDKIRIDQTIQITLNNHGSVARTVEVEEMLPVSRDSRVEVKIGDVDPEPTTENQKGNVTWSVGLEPHAEVQITIPYRITYPRGLRIAGL
jgi:hypothetical protein